MRVRQDTRVGEVGVCAAGQEDVARNRCRVGITEFACVAQVASCGRHGQIAGKRCRSSDTKRGCVARALEESGGLCIGQHTRVAEIGRGATCEKEVASESYNARHIQIARVEITSTNELGGYTGRRDEREGACIRAVDCKLNITAVHVDY